MIIKNYLISELIHPDYNPRKISEDQKKQLRKSIDKFKIVEPAIINTNPDRKNIIVGGNQRINEAEALGYKEFPCVEVDLDLQDEKELNIRLNKNTADFDYTILNEIFPKDFLKECGFQDFELSGMVSLDDIEKEYSGMPEYNNEDLGAYQMNYINRIKILMVGLKWQNHYIYNTLI